MDCFVAITPRNGDVPVLDRSSIKPLRWLRQAGAALVLCFAVVCGSFVWPPGHAYADVLPPPTETYLSFDFHKIFISENTIEPDIFFSGTNNWPVLGIYDDMLMQMLLQSIFPRFNRQIHGEAINELVVRLFGQRATDCEAISNFDRKRSRCSSIRYRNVMDRAVGDKCIALPDISPPEVIWSHFNKRQLDRDSGFGAEISCIGCYSSGTGQTNSEETKYYREHGNENCSDGSNVIPAAIDKFFYVEESHREHSIRGGAIILIVFLVLASSFLYSGEC